MDGTTDQQQQLATVPFRIRPSTGPRPLRLLSLFGLLIIAFVGLAIEIGIISGRLPPLGNGYGMSWSSTYKGRPDADAAWIGIAIPIVVLALSLFNLIREILYLTPRSRYWIEITSDGVGLVTPLTRRHYRWQEISPFTLRTLYMRSWRVLRIVAHAGGWRWVRIRSDDFTTELPGSRREAAARLVEVLNDLLGQVGAGRSTVMKIPAALKTEDATTLPEKSPVKAATVVRG